MHVFNPVVFAVFVCSLNIGGCHGQENFGKCTKSMLEDMGKRISSCNEPLVTYGRSNLQSILSSPSNELFENICAKLFTLYSCSRDVMLSLSCFGSEYQEYMRVTFEATNKATEYLCENKAERALDFFKNKGVQCMMQSGNDIMTCINGTARSLIDFENVFRFDIQKYCRVSEPIKKCLTDPMESNPDICSASLVETVSETVDILNANLGCNGSLKNNGTKGGGPKKTDDGKDNGSGSFLVQIYLLTLSIILATM